MPLSSATAGTSGMTFERFCDVTAIARSLPAFTAPTVGAVKAGKLRAIAVTSQKRSNVMPDVPAVAELKGMGDYRFTNWMGVFAPAKTPAAIVERIGAEIA